jgi:hypothetical protein
MLVLLRGGQRVSRCSKVNGTAVTVSFFYARSTMHEHTVWYHDGSAYGIRSPYESNGSDSAAAGVG